MTPADQITHLKAQLAEAHEAIRELNERASSHLITMMDAAQRLKLELDKANARLRELAAYKTLLNVDKQVERQRVLLEKSFSGIEPYDPGQFKVSLGLAEMIKDAHDKAKSKTFHDCTGVPIGVGKITAPQNLQ